MPREKKSPTRPTRLAANNVRHVVFSERPAYGVELACLVSFDRIDRGERVGRPMRSHGRLLGLITILSCVGGACLPAVHAHQRSTAPPVTLPSGWTALLEAFVDHSEGAKVLVVEKAGQSTDAAVRALADRLKSEWDLPRGAAVLKSPINVHATKIPAFDQIVRAESFVFSVDVGEDGRVLAATFLKHSTQTQLADQALKNVQGALFRPAFKEGRFVIGQVVVTVLIDVK